ncbi:phage tail protein [Escherichia coli]|uniref:phage tail protein n=1 Tax=Escherichia coli TaxID=562 RepID=UPI0039805717
MRFGDGYEQRRPTGLNPQLKTFQAVFRVTDESTRRWLEEFYRGMVVTVPFCGDRRKHNRTVRVVCREWSVTDNARYSDFSCTIEQVGETDAGYSRRKPEPSRLSQSSHRGWCSGKST